MKHHVTQFNRGVSLVLGLTTVLVASSLPMTTLAAALTSGSETLSDARSSQAAVNYSQTFTFPGTANIGCIRSKFTTTATGSTLATGIVTTSATKTSITGGGLTPANWSLTATTNGTLDYKQTTPSATTATSVNLVTAAIQNPTAEGTYFVQTTTYTDNTCSIAVDSQVTAFAITNGVTINVVVDPQLSFAVSGIAASTVYKGALTTSAGCADTATAVNFPAAMTINANYECAQQLVTSTNALNGYTVTVRGTTASNTLVNGGVSIANHTGSNATPAVFGSANEAFGYTTSAAVLGTGSTARFAADDTFAAFTNTAAEVAYNNAPINNQTIKIGFKLRFSGTTAPGNYAGTVVYVATPVF